MSEQPNRYHVESQATLLDILDYMGQRPLEAHTIQTIAADLDLSRDAVNRALWNLENKGWVERNLSGIRLSPRLTQYSDRLRLNLIELSKTYLSI